MSHAAEQNREQYGKKRQFGFDEKRKQHGKPANECGVSDADFGIFPANRIEDTADGGSVLFGGGFIKCLQRCRADTAFKQVKIHKRLLCSGEQAVGFGTELHEHEPRNDNAECDGNKLAEKPGKGIEKAPFGTHGYFTNTSHSVRMMR